MREVVEDELDSILGDPEIYWLPPLPPTPLAIGSMDGRISETSKGDSGRLPGQKLRDALSESQKLRFWKLGEASSYLAASWLDLRGLLARMLT